MIIAEKEYPHQVYCISSEIYFSMFRTKSNAVQFDETLRL